MYKERENTNYLPFIFGCYILGNLLFPLYLEYKWLAIFIASLFFIGFYSNSKVHSGIFFIFTIITIMNINSYYSFIPNGSEYIRVNKINNYYIEGSINGRNFTLDIGNDLELKVGELIRVKGGYKREIDYSKGIIGHYEVKEILDKKQDMISNIYKRREIIFNMFQENLGYRKAALITSISIGDSDRLDYEDKDYMKKLGILHAIAVSGLHMALVYSISQKIIGRKGAVLISFVYLIFTGASNSTIRAFIMILVSNFSIIVKKNYNGIAALSLAGIIIIIMKPYAVFQVGFNLSFLSTLGIILFNNRINKSLYKMPESIRKGIGVSLSSQILSFPYYSLVFNEYYLNFIVGNVILSPIIMAILLLGNLAIILSGFQIIFDYISFNLHYVIKFFDYIVELLSEFSIPYININKYTSVVYLTLLIAYYFYKRGFKKIMSLPISALIWCIISCYSIFPTFKYYREGFLRISYKGENIALKVKNQGDIKEFKNKVYGGEIYDDVSKVILDENLYVEKINNKYFLMNGKMKYEITFSFEKNKEGYDIINLNSNDCNEFVIIENKIILLD